MEGIFSNCNVFWIYSKNLSLYMRVLILTLQIYFSFSLIDVFDLFHVSFESHLPGHNRPVLCQ